MMSLLQFVIDVCRAVFHEGRARYYRIALTHVGEGHRDAWLIARRMVHSQMVVNDFLRRTASRGRRLR